MSAMYAARSAGRRSVVENPRRRRRIAVVTIVAVVAGISLALCSLMTGSTPLRISEVFSALFGGDHAAIVAKVRLPRMLAGLAIGAALGISGAVFQSVSRNPLGSPDLIGFVTGAATGAVVAIVFFRAAPVVVSLAAVVGGFLTALAVVAFSRRGDGVAGYRLILVGIGVGAFLQALNALLLTRSDADTAISAQLWLTGTLNAMGWPDATIALCGLLVLAPMVFLVAKQLGVLELGDDFAAQLGINLDVVRVLAIVAATGLAAFATAAAGPIAFVALAAPHLARRIAATPATPFALAGVFGAVLLLGADVLSQSLPLGLRVPVALMTGVLGGGYLLWLLTRSRWR